MLNLILPVIFPSWRFFSSVGPSPRVHYAFLKNESGEAATWFEFRPLPKRIDLKGGLRNLLHNPEWNERLYINTCAERLFEGYSAMREQEIMQRILAAIERGEIEPEPDCPYLTFRICAVMREGQDVHQQVIFTASPVLISAAEEGNA